ncbi:MAG: cysteine desulfurase [Desulfobacterales bacterium]|nr:cysteine desulfurase [Desulfobacterales bacterium]
MTKSVYLDYNASTPVDPDVMDAMRPFFEKHFGNPSSTHLCGIIAKKAVENARSQVASLLNCKSEEIIFTSGGTESNNFAIKGVARALWHKGKHIITSQIEHSAVLDVCGFLEKNGFEITYLPVDEDGLVNISNVKRAIRPDTILISIMHANNEVGTIQPVEEIAGLAKECGIVMHTDAAQSVGKISANVHELGVDLLSIAGHKMYAPKGIGVLYVKKSAAMERFHHGAGQEMGLRAGTENVPGIVGLGQACKIAKNSLESNIKHMKKMRDMLYEGLKNRVENIKLNGHTEKRVPNTLNLSFKGLIANRILEEIGLEIAASSGAACHPDRMDISHVLKAMGIPWDWAKGTLRFSTGRMTTRDEIDKAIEVISVAVDNLKSGK